MFLFLPILIVKFYTFFYYKNQIIFVEARCSYPKMAKISNFAHTLPLFYASKMHFRMSTFIHNNSTIRNLASSWVTSPDGCKSEPNCSYKVCSYKRKKVYCSCCHRDFGRKRSMCLIVVPYRCKKPSNYVLLVAFHLPHFEHREPNFLEFSTNILKW